MAILEFETSYSNGVLQVPEEIAAQLSQGEKVRVSITPAQGIVPSDDAWKAILTFIRQRKPLPSAESYSWNRDDAYRHLKNNFHRN
jgi:hypothetical protein